MKPILVLCPGLLCRYLVTSEPLLAKVDGDRRERHASAIVMGELSPKLIGRPLTPALDDGLTTPSIRGHGVHIQSTLPSTRTILIWSLSTDLFYRTCKS